AVFTPTATAVDGSWWRQIGPGRDPLSRPDPPPDGRWQRGEVTDALYFGDTQETVWAEFLRHLAEAAIPPEQANPRDLWERRLSLGNLADLRTPERLADIGLSMPSPSRKEWPAFQRAGERLHGEGYNGLIAPSAAIGKGLVL